MINLGKFQGKGLTREFIVIHTSGIPNRDRGSSLKHAAMSEAKTIRKVIFSACSLREIILGNSQIHFGTRKPHL